VPIVLKSGSLNVLETSGPVKASNGIDLPQRILIKNKYEEPIFVIITTEVKCFGTVESSSVCCDEHVYLKTFSRKGFQDFSFVKLNFSCSIIMQF
jgi:hypothetical protein